MMILYPFLWDAILGLVAFSPLARLGHVPSPDPRDTETHRAAETREAVSSGQGWDGI